MKAGIQPIIGAVVSLRDQDGTGEVVLLSQSDAGYVNLSDLISQALLATDPTQKPKIVCEALAQRSTGLLLLSGGYATGFLGKPAWNRQDKVAEKRAQWLKSVFAENAYIELQRHGRTQEENAEGCCWRWLMRKVCRQATNDCLLKLSKCMCRNVCSDVLPSRTSR